MLMMENFRGKNHIMLKRCEKSKLFNRNGKTNFRNSHRTVTSINKKTFRKYNIEHELMTFKNMND